jgi:hypothetical protein
LNPREALRELTNLGYHFEVEGKDLHYWFEGQDCPDPQQVEPMLELIREHKTETLAFLEELAPSCYECGHFLPGGSPNPTEAWGRCGKQAQGRYGCALACWAFYRYRDKPENKPVPPMEPETVIKNLGPCQGNGCGAPALDIGQEGQPLCWACLSAMKNKTQ